MTQAGSFVLSESQREHFAREGYLVVKGVVAERFLQAADAEIDRCVQAEPPPRRTLGAHAITKTPELLPAANSALVDSGALAIVEQLTAPESLTLILNHIQIALNLPPLRHEPGGPHIDGNVRQYPTQDRPDSFTVLAGGFLCDEMAPHRGNLWIWPRSHFVHERLLAERGTSALMANGGHITGLDDPPPLSEARSVLGDRGDLLICHYLLGHNHGGNLSDRTRRMLYYRLANPAHPGRREAALTDVFLEFQELRHHRPKALSEPIL